MQEIPFVVDLNGRLGIGQLVDDLAVLEMKDVGPFSDLQLFFMARLG
nr:hypothetical protein [Desulfobacula sp.]